MTDPTRQKIIDDMCALRDEIRLKIHLAGMDARDGWAKLEGQARVVERELMAAARETVEAARLSAEKLKKAMESLRDQVRRPS